MDRPISAAKFDSTIGLFYQLVGLRPGINSNGGLSRVTLVKNTVMLLGYWIGYIFSHFRADAGNSIVSKSSNHIQLGMFVIAFTIVVGSPLIKYCDYVAISKHIESIDHRIQRVNAELDYRKQIMVFRVSLIGVLLVLFYIFGFDFYVSIVLGSRSFGYMLVFMVPLVFYILAMHQGIFTLWCICHRLKVIGDTLRRVTQEEKLSPTITILMPRTTTASGFADQKARSVRKLRVTSAVDVKQEMFRALNETYSLCETVNSYFGPTFLAVLGASFVTSSVQSFYAISIYSSQNDVYGRTYWNLTGSINLVLINISIVIPLCWASEKVLKLINTALAMVNQKEKEQDSSEELIWLKPMMTQSRFSAMGFFEINYNMCFGFISALLTYLVILVQFNALSDNSKNPHSGYGGATAANNDNAAGSFRGTSESTVGVGTGFYGGPNSEFGGAQSPEGPATGGFGGFGGAQPPEGPATGAFGGFSARQPQEEVATDAFEGVSLSRVGLSPRIRHVPYSRSEISTTPSEGLNHKVGTRL